MHEVAVILQHKKEEVMHLLLIDQSGFTEVMLRKIFKAKPEVKISRASTGEGGIRKALELDPDVIITEFHFFDTDGLEVAYRLKKEEKLRARVILWTGYLSDYIKREAGYLGIETCLQKPVYALELRELILSNFNYQLEPAKVVQHVAD